MTNATGPSRQPAKATTGIDGLDDILAGGLTSDRMYLIEGVPGSGKTTLAVQFLLEGVRRGEAVLYVTLSETEPELQGVADSHGWLLDGVTIQQLVPSEDSLQPDEQYTVFHPSEVELGEAIKAILAAVERVNPARVVLDSLSELRLLSGTALRYRRQILAMKQYFAGRHCTVLLLDDLTSTDRDLQVQSIAHGVILLEQLNPEYGAERRRLRVVKYRGQKFRGGFHDYVILRGGLRVFPRLVAAEHHRTGPRDKLPSGIAELDTLLGGGIEQGTSTLLVGAAGTGKSSLAARFAATAADHGQSSALFIFDENLDTLLIRATGLGIDLRKHIETGRVMIRQVDPAELSPGEFAHRIREAVERDQATIVVIDSLNGYLNAMPEERFLIIQLHELLSYLAQRGVATLLVGAHQGLIGGPMQSPVDATYLADAVVLLRYFESRGEVRQAISVVKKRGGAHERTIREFRLESGGIRVGEPLRRFRGVLTGVPTFEGDPEPVTEKPQVMTDSEQANLERRLLVLAPTGKDSALTLSVLREAEIACVPCTTLDGVVTELQAGAGALLLVEEAIPSGHDGPLTAALAAQPAWSDLPILVFTHAGADSAIVAHALKSLGNVTLLERPTRVASLVSAARSALRARQRQYQIRDQLAERERHLEALRQADRRKDEFLATLAHELRNPLAPIRNSLNLLRLAGSLGPTEQPICEMMERPVNHLVRLVDDLMEVSRVTRGKIELRREQIELAAVIRSAVETSRPLIDAAGHQLSISLPIEPVFLDGDLVRLAQVFANLLNNAAKYTDRGGQISIAARTDGGHVSVTVRDTGIGIQPEMLPRVFEMFTQIDLAAGRAQGGLGIGLALVRALVEMHHGQVEARSGGPGQGSEFIVRLQRLVDSSLPERTQFHSAPSAELPPCRVLVVDDNQDAADSLGLLLKVLGAEVQVVYDGASALNAVESFRPVAAFLDVGMPDMDGHELARRIRENPLSAKMTLIAVTGWSQAADRLRTRMAGFDYHLIKPADLSVVQGLLVSVARPEECLQKDVRT